MVRNLIILSLYQVSENTLTCRFHLQGKAGTGTMLVILTIVVFPISIQLAHVSHNCLRQTSAHCFPSCFLYHSEWYQFWSTAVQLLRVLHNAPHSVPLGGLHKNVIFIEIDFLIEFRLWNNRQLVTPFGSLSWTPSWLYHPHVPHMYISNGILASIVLYVGGTKRCHHSFHSMYAARMMDMVPFCSSFKVQLDSIVYSHSICRVCMHAGVHITHIFACKTNACVNFLSTTGHITSAQARPKKQGFML